MLILVVTVLGLVCWRLRLVLVVVFLGLFWVFLGVFGLTLCVICPKLVRILW